VSVVIAVSGSLRSGKTTLARALAETLGCPRASFGDYVRSKAQEAGLGHDRATLQDLGEQLIEIEGWRAFCENTIALAGAGAHTVPLVVDGVRHVTALDALRELFAPVRVVLAHVDAGDEQARITRLEDDATYERPLEAIEAHSTERDAKQLLPDQADLHVSASDGVEAACREVMSWLRANGLT
jgi:adenylate kinase family enzyme